MIKIDYIKISGVVFFLAIGGIVHTAQNVFPDTVVDDSANAVNYKPILGVSVIAFAAASVYGYKKNEKIKNTLDSYAESLKDSVVHHVVLPLSIKAEEIKDEGFKSSDVMKLGCGISICYGLKKAADFFHVKNLFYGDTTKTVQALKVSAKEYKKIIIGAGIIVASTYFLWKHCCKGKHPLSVLEKLNLTTEQREKLECSDELAPFVHEANYVGLLDSDLFTEILTDEQKKVREEIINEYLSESSLDFLNDIDTVDSSA